MRLACSTFAFEGLPLAQTFARIRDLGFRYADLVLSDDPRWGHVSPQQLQNDPLLVLENLEEAEGRSGVKVVAFNVTLNRSSLAERGQFEAVCQLARRVGVPVISVGAGRGDELVEFRRLRDFLALAREFGAILAIETLYPSLFQEPAAAAAFVEGLRGARLTLDTGHLLQQGIATEDWKPLYRHVGHVHVRDAGPSIPRHQVPLGSGGLNLPLLLGGLAAVGYDAALTIEYLGNRPDNVVSFDGEAEIVKLRDALQAAVPDLRSEA